MYATRQRTRAQTRYHFSGSSASSPAVRSWQKGVEVAGRVGVVSVGQGQQGGWTRTGRTLHGAALMRTPRARVPQASALLHDVHPAALSPPSSFRQGLANKTRR
jgi:hypothetical protein